MPRSNDDYVRLSVDAIPEILRLGTQLKKLEYGLAATLTRDPNPPPKVLKVLDKLCQANASFEPLLKQLRAYNKLASDRPPSPRTGK